MYKQEVSAGRGQKMQKPYTLHFGLGWTSTIDSVVIIWPGPQQKKDKFTTIQPLHVYTLTEGGNVKVSVGKTVQSDAIFNIYPNPSTDQVNISLYLPEEKEATIEVYNSMMQKVAVLFDGKLKNNNYEFSFSAHDRNLTPAVYFCRISLGDKTLVKQFIITE
jgi:hypothetical protein